MTYTEELSNSTNSDRVEILRLTLEHEQQRPVSYSEAMEVGDALIKFYKTLADSGGPNGQEI
jgi:hypothetical protein